MKILYIYQFLTYGGVEMLLKRRAQYIRKYYPDSEVNLLVLESFVHDIPSAFNNVYITKDREKIKKLMEENDVLVDVDTPGLFNIIDNVKKPLIIECHSFFPESREYISKKLPHNTKMVVVPSLAFQSIIQDEISNKEIPVEYVYNIVEKSINNKDSLYINLEKFRPILWVGRLEDNKNWQSALNILSTLVNEYGHNEIELFFVGNVVGSYKKSLLDTIKDMGLLSYARYISGADFKYMGNIYNQVYENKGIYLSTSKCETFGLTVVEAMAYGLPCVINNLEVFREISDGKSLIFDNEKEAAEQINQLLKDDNEWNRLSNELLIRSEEFYPEKNIKKLITLYKEAQQKI